MVTIEEIAKEAGVSVGTVSNVINNVPSVKESNRAKVMKAIEKLDYHVNPIARSLRSNEPSYIGLIVPNITNPFFSELARGVELAAQAAGFSLLFCNDDRSYQKEKHCLELLLDKGVSGVIIAKSQIGEEELKAYQRRCPLVFSDFHFSDPDSFSVINVDDTKAMRAVIDLFKSFGHKRIAFIEGLDESPRTHARHDFLLSYAESQGVPIASEYLKRGNYEWESGYYAAKRLLELEVPPTAVYCSNDYMAVGAMKAMLEKGLSIPEDISVVGYDNIELARMYTPSLTTIDNPARYNGDACFEMLYKNIAERRSNQGHENRYSLLLEANLIVRDSVGPVPPGRE